MGKEPSSFSYSPSPLLLGSDDPSMIQESESLLSQFMRSSSHDAQNPSLGSSHRHGASSHTHAALQDVSVRNDWNEPTPEHASKPNQKPHGDLVTRPSSSRRQNPFFQISTPGQNDGQAQPPQNRVKIPRGNTQMRPQRASQPSTGLGHSVMNIRPTSDRKVVLPATREKGSSSVRRQSPQSSQARSPPQEPRVRRSCRPKSGPTNYYAPLHIGESWDEEAEEIKPRSSRKPKSLPNHPTTSIPRPPPLQQAARRRPFSSRDSLLMQRELGHKVDHLRSNLMSNFKLSKSWKGASNDVEFLAWSPDGTRFAAGAAAQCDEHNLQYNRKNNLILGDITKNLLYELPDHWVPLDLNRNAASRIMGDSRLFMSVTAVEWHQDTLYTASYDKTVRLWDVSKDKATCYKTLRHDSKVVVMARSNLNENVLATGTRSIGLWDIKKSQYTALELPRPRSKKEIELSPTSLAWGINGPTKNILLAGMAEKDDGISASGLLAAWQIGESTATPLYYTPNSQTIFDIKWHPALPTFVTASSAGQLAGRNTRSVVSIYEPIRFRTRTMELECPALDMNEVAFCPLNANYVAASCTDGVTYVWDCRKAGNIVHRLQHGRALNQLDETMTREQADVGVRLHLWGDGMDQLYTGASDGVLKRWDIRLSPEDVLIQDVFTFQEEITCGAFSNDKSNLLIGDSSGGVHILSTGPLTTGDDLTMRFIESPSSINPESESDSESHAMPARELIASGELEQHPIFGPGKGPRYKGPFAAWARPDGTPADKIANTPLIPEREICQLSGPEPKYRKGISEKDQRHVEGCILVSKMRNQRPGKNKRRKEKKDVGARTVAFGNGNFIDISAESDDDIDGSDFQASPKNKRRLQKAVLSPLLLTQVEAEIIDLTNHDSESSVPVTPREAPKEYRRQNFKGEEDLQHVLEDLEDDFWWPESGEISPNIPSGQS
ncbi:hypothetical protein P175DRAFT_0240432 [Aspergillus ochraceoroseus IBT 24754]|uniref:Uncharacterized protein n=2 Tax=Aspergillus ochraceoroseus TaxID=138278 RepID=A0A2T5LXG2_9EURO|nr:uncharacterized protein P175DRAFT_0240432 [Aspergillus ochraceoroseus IBT 24754]KKK19130.1 hypothetical protein AOCH_002850 [Aspergillus ochraceoroseus]PTU20967.1 hypothetical protein P175DRAFT_0240432 [Aspergillus ochraceoroseus IBT 24754]